MPKQPDAANRPNDLIIGASLVSATALAMELRRRLILRLSRHRRQSQWELLTIARNILREYEPILAENLANGDLASWIAGVDQVVKKLPGGNITAFLREGGGLPPKPPIDVRSLFGEGQPDEPIVRFPLLERAAKSLQERQIVTREQFEKLADEAKQRAFTVSYVDSEDTIDAIREVLQENLEEGPSLHSFQKALEARLGASPIGPGHLETVYRTNLQAAFTDGRETIADHPIVSAIFVYQEYLPIRDARARKEHLDLGKLGLSGTGIYRRDDPFWNLFTPPWDYNCRCGVNLLTIEAAARKGVREAKEWLRTGRPPVVPEWRIDAIPFPGNPGFGSRRRRAAA